MVQVVSFFGIAIPVAPLVLLLSYIVACELAERSLGRIAPSSSHLAWRRALTNASSIALLSGLIAGRIAYSLENLQLYAQTPELVLSLCPGILAPLPVILVTCIIIWIFLWRAHIPLAYVADAFAIGAAAALLVLSLGDFLTGSNYGMPANLYWGVDLCGAIRHPVQLYDALALMTILSMLWYLQPRLLSGEVFWRFILLYSLSQLIINTFRANAITWGPGIRVWQTVSLIGLLLSLYVLSLFARTREQANSDRSIYRMGTYLEG